MKTESELNHFVEQMVMFRDQELWIVAEFKKALAMKATEFHSARLRRKRINELTKRAQQWMREYIQFLQEAVDGDAADSIPTKL